MSWACQAINWGPSDEGESVSASTDLGSNITKLARVHHSTIQTDAGTRYVKALPLINQLRAAITPSGDGGTGGSPMKQRLPLDDHALDTFNEIDGEARYLLGLCSLRRYQPEHLEQVVLAYQRETLKFGEGEIGEAARITSGWVRRIENLLTPPKSRRPLRQPCPSCGELWDMYTGERVYALTAWCDGPPAAWEVACAACGAGWVGEQIGFLLAAQNAA